MGEGEGTRRKRLRCAWGWTRRKPFGPPPLHPLPPRDCVTIAEMVKNVMLNLFQHLMESITYETLKRVQGDKKMNYDTASNGGGLRWGCRHMSPSPPPSPPRGEGEKGDD